MDICTLGEMVVDLTPVGKSKNGNTIYEQNPGGAPANVACAAAKLNVDTAIITMLGRDQFGACLAETLKRCGVCMDGVKYCDERTGIAIITLSETGNRSFVFYRNPCADQMLSEKDVSLELIERCKIFHFSSVSLASEISAKATLYALMHAREKGRLISFDVNYREMLAADTVQYKKLIESVLPSVDILKVSEDESQIFSGLEDIEQAAARFYGLGIKMVVITLGPRGCYYLHGKSAGYVPAYDLKAVDTTGAGDNFVAAMLARFVTMKKSIDKLDREDVIEMLEYANAAGSICASRYGTISAMASHEEIKDCLKNTKKLVFY
jgi:fructokinase